MSCVWLFDARFRIDLCEIDVLLLNIPSHPLPVLHFREKCLETGTSDWQCSVSEESFKLCYQVFSHLEFIAKIQHQIFDEDPFCFRLIASFHQQFLCAG